MKWQGALGLPATGFFGPMSRAKVNASATGTVGGTTIGGTTTGGISTPGVEGTLTATLSPIPGSGTTVREGDSKKAVLGVELKAKLSDIKIERVKVKLDALSGNADKDFYRDLADRMYVMDGSTVLASVDLNSDTVVEETTGNYYVTVTGLNLIVRKDATKTLTIAIDAQDSIDSDLTGDSWTVTIEDEGIRGVDGAGVNQYTDGSYARTFTSDNASSEDASVTISTAGTSPLTGEVVASNGSDEDELDGLTLLAFDVKAEDDDVTITDLTATITPSGSGTATTTTAYLYAGNTLVGSASVIGTSAVFDDIDYTVSENTTKTLTIKVDVRDASVTSTSFTASVSNGNITVENSEGDSATKNGSASGNTITVLKVGPQFSLVSKSISKSATASQNNTSTSTVSADFVVRITAVGGDIYFGTQSASSTFAFQTYKGGTATTLLVASSTSFDVPSSGAGVVAINANGQAFRLQEGASIDLPAHFIFEGRTTAGALVSTDTYSVGLENIKWSSTGTSTQTSSFMAGGTEWRTSSVTLP